MSSKSKKKSSVRRKQVTGSESASRTSTSPDRAVLGVCAFLFVSVALVFGRSLSFGFVDFDDIAKVSENPFVNKGITLPGVIWAFSHGVVGDWIPLTTMSHMLDCQLFGLWAGGHHLVNVLLHAATSILLFLVLRSMTGSLWRCAFVAAIFALHPLRAESVAWISERKDVLSAFFFMLTLGAYVRWTRHPEGSRWWFPVALALGLLSKTMLITTPLVLLLLDYWPLQRMSRDRFKRLLMEKIPLFLLSAAASVGQLLASRPGLGSMDSYPLARRLANAVVSCATYVVQMFWPAGLAGFYPYPRQGVDSLALVAATVFLVAVSIAAFRWRRQVPWLAVGWLWYLVMLLPVLGVIQTGEVARADRYTYLPQIGLYLVVAWDAGSWCAGHRERRLMTGSVAAMMLVAVSLLAFRQTGFWKDSETLWLRALECTPLNDTPHYNLGTGLLQKGRLDEAKIHFEKALEANSGYADAHINLGRVLLQKGMPAEAMAHYQQAIEVKPGYAEAHYNIAVVLGQNGQIDQAIARYQKALEIHPGYFDAQNNLGSDLFRAGRTEEAIAHFEKALRIDSGSAKAHHNLATAFAQQGRLAEAVSHYQTALKIDPGHAKAANSLAWLLATSSETAIRDGFRAVELAGRASRLAGGGNPLMLRTLAAAQAETGKFDEATRTAQRALDLATAQGDEKLARFLRGDIGEYQGGRPLR